MNELLEMMASSSNYKYVIYDINNFMQRLYRDKYKYTSAARRFFD